VPVVLFDDVVQIFTAAHTDPFGQLAVALQVSHSTVGGGISIQSDFRGNALLLHCLTQKRFGRIHIPLPAQMEIHRLAGLVDGAVKVDPFALDLNIGFVAAPRATNLPGLAFPALLELGCIVLYPPENRGVGQFNAAFRHHGHQVAIAQFETEIPANTQDHDFLVEVPTFEQLLGGCESWHRPIISEAREFAPEPFALLVAVLLANIATVDPPLGLIGFISPVAGAGYLFPGTGWPGLIAESRPVLLKATVSISKTLRRSYVRLPPSAYLVSSKPVNRARSVVFRSETAVNRK
jgi:hypothetical protein